jgi:stearoyl-CoA desaturase (delta-9 desaturase)
MLKDYLPYFVRVTLVQILLGIIAIGYLLNTGNTIWLWATFIAWFLGYVMGEGVFLHRYFSHKTFETYPWLAKTFALIALQYGFGGPITFRTVHILHHSTSDTEKDVHSPVNGIWQSCLMWRAHTIKDAPFVVSKHLMRDKFYVFLETHSVKIWWVTFFILAVIDWRLALFTQGLGGLMGIVMAAISNCFSHLYGTRRFETSDNSRNNWVLSWLLWQGAIALHNNHHAHPARYHDSHAWYEFDIGKYIIPLIATKINER